MYFSLPYGDVLERLQSSTEGLDENSVQVSRDSCGWNELPEKKTPWWVLLLRQFQDVMIYILIGALFLTIAVRAAEGDGSLEHSIDIFAILAILLLNAALGFAQEFRSEQALLSLKSLTSPSVRVRRGRQEMMIPSRELVCGDIVLLETGDRISADGRLILLSHLEVNESSLTGESSTVTKTTDIVKEGSAIGDQRNMVFAGTIVTRGSATYVVTAVGTESEIGRIATLVAAAKPPPTPLEVRMKKLSGFMGMIVLVLCSILAGIEYMRGLPFLEIVLLAVSLAVSAVPEGLPAVVTACLAMGVRKMVGINALVMRLDALETLGSISVICSDKTGTITENKMAVRETWTVKKEKEEEELLIQIASSCNRAVLPDIGDPTEVGLLKFAKDRAVERLSFDEEEVPFGSEHKYMQTRHGSRSFLKGAPEQILALCTSPDTEQIEEQSRLMAERGLRVLAMAISEVGIVRFVGLIGMEDPPRAAVEPAMEEARRAGIRTVMITGDHAVTARAIAKQIGMDGDVVEGRMLDTLTNDVLLQTVRTVSIYARVSPTHKIAILKALQSQGEIVAMTGDGVNDAPALRAANVGIAMGKDGTQVAREAASLVLTDDNYATIVVAIREGRRIYDNIRKFILYLVRANVGQMLLFTFTVALGLPLPLLPIHILWINVMTDGLPALALGMEKEEPNIMHRPPRPPSEQIFSGVWIHLLVASLTSCLLTFGLFAWHLSEGDPIDHVRTIVFTFSIFFEILLAFHSRSVKRVWEIGMFRNRWLTASAILPFALQMLILLTPLRSVFSLMPLTMRDLVILVGVGTCGFLFLEISKPFFAVSFPVLRRATR